MSEKNESESKAPVQQEHVIRCPKIFGLEVKVVENACERANQYSECGRCPFARL